MRQFWYRAWQSRLLILLVLLAVGLLIVAFYLQADNKQQESRYAAEDTLSFGDVIIRIVYPNNLHVEPTGTTGRQLILQVSYTGVNNVPIRAVIDFSASNNLIFTDNKGRVVPSILTFGSGMLPNSRVLYIQPMPLQDILPQSTYLKVTAKTFINNLPYAAQSKVYPVAIESPIASKMRFWTSPLTQNAIIFLSLAIAIVGWAIADRYRQQDQEARNLQGLVESLQSDVDAHPLEAMQRLPRYEERAKLEDWDEVSQTHLNLLHKRLMQRDYIERALVEIVRTLKREGNSVISTFDTLATIMPFARPNSDANTKQPGGKRSTVDDNTKYNKIKLLEFSLTLWDEYGESARELVSLSLQEMWKKEPDEIRKLLTSESQKLLLRSPELVQIKPEWASYVQIWPPLKFQVHYPSPERLTEWLNLNGNQLIKNPFAFFSFDALKEVLAYPKQWEFIEDVSYVTVVQSEMGGDNEISSLALHDVLQLTKKVFPYLVIAESSKTLLENPLLAITWAYHDQWISFLKLNPNAFFEITEVERETLSAFLTWREGNLTIFNLQSKDWEVQKKISAIANELRKAERKRLITKGPSRDEMLTWLSLRPAGIQSSCLLVRCTELNKMEIQRCVTGVLNLSPMLNEICMGVKIFVPPIKTRQVKKVTLGWSPQTLEAVLSSLIQRASNSYELKFGDLFTPRGFPEADDLLIKEAKGSFSKLLEIGNAVIEKHVMRDPNNPYLNEDDLLDILRERGGR